MNPRVLAAIFTALPLVALPCGVLIDAPFTRADAHRTVAAVLESGKTLDTIFVTHDHPDHFCPNR
jgi:glyoxylase-like metal-dependent hydrolase (beta-lactamase superfamily II)